MELPQLSKGSIIQGKWYKNQYQVLGKLGQGGTGAVYCVKSLENNHTYAIKVAGDNLSINREYELLRYFEKSSLIVQVYELDDIEIGAHTFYYILLEYIEGENLLGYIEKKKLNLHIILGIMILLVEGIKEFFQAGYVLGDVKLENIMVDRKERRTRLIDLGGVVEIGGGIKEFTPLYDRGSWQCGERRAEESYMLFSISMVAAKLLIREKLNPQTQHIKEVVIKIKKLNINEEIKDLIIEGLEGKASSLENFAIRLRRLYNKESISRKKEQKTQNNFIINVALVVSLCFFMTTILMLVWF